MIKLTNELTDLMDKFEEQFDAAVPLLQISQGYTTEHLIESIKKCLKDNINYLPEIYGYANDDGSVLY